MRILGVDGMTEFTGSQYKLTTNGTILLLFSKINMMLAVFNLLPIHPLDGGQIFGAYLRRHSPNFEYKLRIYGPYLLMSIVFLNIFFGISILSYILFPFEILVFFMGGLL